MLKIQNGVLISTQKNILHFLPPRFLHALSMEHMKTLLICSTFQKLPHTMMNSKQIIPLLNYLWIIIMVINKALSLKGSQLLHSLLQLILTFYQDSVKLEQLLQVLNPSIWLQSLSIFIRSYQKVIKQEIPAILCKLHY